MCPYCKPLQEKHRRRITESMGGRIKAAHFRALFEQQDSNVSILLDSQLLQPNRSTQSCGPTANNTNIHLIRFPLNAPRIKLALPRDSGQPESSNKHISPESRDSASLRAKRPWPNSAPRSRRREIRPRRKTRRCKLQRPKRKGPDYHCAE